MNWLPATPELLADVIARTQGKAGNDPESNLRVSRHEQGLGHFEVYSSAGSVIAGLLKRSGGAVTEIALDEEDSQIRGAFLRFRFEALRGIPSAIRPWPIGEAEMPRREGNPNAFGRKAEEEEEEEAADGVAP